MKQKQQWHLIDWDGNPDLKLKCWRKKFGRGHVSVGVGDFKHIVFDYGDNSDDSISSTRARLGEEPDQTEKEAMEMVDKNKGRYK